MDEALRCTYGCGGGCYRVDDRLGTLEVGKLADVVVLDADPFATPSERLGDIAVELTILGGEIVYRADALEGHER